MSDYQVTFQNLLRELFQFDCADLDFGIYRIMNYKRDAIERFISTDLPQAIAQELEQGALAEQSQAAQALEAARKKVLEALGDDALDAGGNLAEKYHETKAGKEYVEAQARAKGSRGRDALEAAVYNHLYAFFSRYWQDGDFISKRRYSKKERYAIPYNGEEVYLYWANHDQYYIKTGEYFADYTWKAPNGVTVHFKLRRADVEQNNIKGEKRFFLPLLKEIAWDETARQQTIPFEYRPLTEQEAITYGQKNQQEAIIAKAIDEIPRRLKAPDALAALTAERRTAGNADGSSALEYHLRQYTRRNTSDFFIHKDLKGFLSRELDFYLKNEVLNLDEMETAGENLAEGWFQLLRLIKRIGLRIIEFLAQIEDFQKMLWEKRKFIVETQYCITVGNIPEIFYPEIAACEAQWDEWRKLGLFGGAGVSGSAGVSPAMEAVSMHKSYYSRGYLPHFDAENVFQFITFRLHDSVPAAVIEEWKQELHWHEGIAADSKEAAELRKRIEKYADSGKGSCYLRDERIARLVQEALQHFDGQRYHLIAWCIMPNHVHVLIQMMGEPLADIVHSWKSYTAHEANKLLKRTGEFWMKEYFDRYIRDEQHFKTTVEYILQNPVNAGLVDSPEQWKWSGFPGSAFAGSASVSDASSNTSRRDACVPGFADICSGHRITFLKAHPTLVLDTRHFPPNFTDRLLASFENLDEMTDGLLVHSENWQALNLLQEKYREQVQCIYIDPPYNTGNDEFIYRDRYQHSSWIAMMDHRLVLAKGFLHVFGAIFVSVDDNEQAHLRLLMDELYGANNLITSMVWEGGLKNDSRFTSVSQDYIVNYVLDREQLASADRKWRTRKEGIDDIYREVERLKKQHGSDWAAISSSLKEWYRHLPKGHPAYAHKHYSWVDEKGVYFPGDISWPGGGGPRYEVLHPTTGKPVAIPQRGWVFAKPETMRQAIQEGRVHFGPDETSVPNLKRYLHETEGQVLPAVFYKDRRAAFKELRDILGHDGFANPKDPYILGKLIEASADNDAWILDFFAGSGTTGHAVINLNREDGGRRKFILVEMADYFDTVLLPRIKKVTFTPEWKDGKPKRMATQEEAERSPRIVKVIRLESYEDALNNLTLDREGGPKALELFKDEYLLSYMLKWETRHSETLLNVEQLQSPFSYKLHIHRDGETRERSVDLPETFNYLLGLDTQTRRVYDDEGRRYLVYRGALRNGRTVAVIWRETKDWTVEDYKRDRDFVKEQKLTDGADEIYTNGDSYIPGARSLDGLFKARLFAPVEA